MVPYLIFGCTLTNTTGPTESTDIQANNQFATPQEPISLIENTTTPENQDHIKDSCYLDIKADSLCDIYIQNMLDTHQRLRPLMGTCKYARAVRQELPGAPVGAHCLYGQFTHLARALDTMGDTITIIPEDARMACINFKNQMRQKYAHIPSCIYEGRMHESDSIYNTALNTYLKSKNITAATDDSIRAKHTAKFAQNNFSADAISPGTIMIVPRHRGSRNTFHAIMFLGRGYIENGDFIPDSTHKHIYAGHNRENIGDLFRTFDTSNVFVANTRNIVRTEYQQELSQIKEMSNYDLANYLSPNNEDCFTYISRDILLNMARDKYFNHYSKQLQMAINKITGGRPHIYTFRTLNRKIY